PFLDAVKTINEAKGRLIVTGMGKSGHIAKKLAATLASTGTPAFFVHPGEASHGDLGMIRAVDVVLALSWSGETSELANIISFTRRFKVPLIALTSGEQSTLATQADIALCLPKAEEACPLGLAPTTSTTMQLCLGDALAVALLENRGFTASDFKIYHPGGSLGANLQYIRD
ncbi:MAG: SIS domain-containing protein, partial [Cohaesibacter sp.]|nr:SIS domain-containing protein [Cohaesibacter sp.]